MPLYDFSNSKIQMNEIYRTTVNMKPKKIIVWGSYFLFFILTATFLIIMVGTYAKKEFVTGIVRHSNYIKIHSDVKGTIQEINAKPGDKVNEGNILFRISNHPAEQDVDAELKGNRESRLLEFNKILKQIEQDDENLTKRNNIYTANYADLITQNQKSKQLIVTSSLLAKEQVKLLEREAHALESLLTNGSVRRSEYDNVRKQLNTAKLDVINFEVQIEESDKTFINLKNSKINTENEYKEKKRSFQVQMNEQKERIYQFNRDEYHTIVAKHSGYIDSVMHRVGDPINPNVTLAVIKIKDNENENEKIEIMLFVPASKIGIVQLGQKVSLRIETYAYQIYGTLAGVVKWIPESPVTAGVDETGKITSFYPVLVKPEFTQKYSRKDLSQEKMKDGMTLSASLSQKSVPIYEWLFYPTKTIFND